MNDKKDPKEEIEDQEPSSKLIEEEDYYVENGLFVFTAAYHLKRGYCCNSGCRHCPYKTPQK